MFISHNLSKIIEIKNVKIYQIATDCVYSGIKGNYDEFSKVMLRMFMKDKKFRGGLKKILI